MIIFPGGVRQKMKIPEGRGGRFCEPILENPERRGVIRKIPSMGGYGYFLELHNYWKNNLRLCFSLTDTGVRAGTVVRALASHRCGPSSILSSDHMWAKFVVGSFSAPRGFARVLRFPLSSKTSTSKFQFDQMQDLPENLSLIHI